MPPMGEMKMIRIMHRCVIIVGAILLAAGFGSFSGPCVAAAPMAQVDILDQWRGYGSGYRERPCFFLIRSLPELQVFWEKHAPDEPMPYVNFEKRMLFFWVPGPSLFGYRVMKAVRIVPNDGRYLLELDIVRSDQAGAGVWRSPWLMALLPRFRGDIEVVRKGDVYAGEAKQMPLAIIRDMGIEPGASGITTVSTGAGKAKPEPAGKEDAFGMWNGAALKSGSGAAPSGALPASDTAVATSTQNSGVQPESVKTDNTGKSGAESGTQPSPAVASAEEDPFGDAFNLDF